MALSQPHQKALEQTIGHALYWAQMAVYAESQVADPAMSVGAYAKSVERLQAATDGLQSFRSSQVERDESERDVLRKMVMVHSLHRERTIKARKRLGVSSVPLSYN